jgi:hypothetical protein
VVAQYTVVDVPATTDAGFAVSVIVGAGYTTTADLRDCCTSELEEINNHQLNPKRNRAHETI